MRRWQRAVLEYLDGVEDHLCPSAPKAARTALARLRTQVRKGTMKEIEPRLESVLRSKPYFRAATRRYVNAVLAEAITVLKEFVEQMHRHQQGSARDHNNE